MSDGPPLSEQNRPAPADRGPAPTVPLGTETIVRLEAMAATILAGSIAMARADLGPAAASALAVELAVGVANELRLYRIVDGIAVKPEGKDG